MDRRPIGGTLIIAAVLLISGTAIAAALGLDVVTPTGPGYLLVVGCLALLGCAAAVLGVGEPFLEGALARRGLKTEAIGLLGFAALLFQGSRPGFEGSKVMVLFFPFMIFGWAIAIGAFMTVASLIRSGGRERRVGAAFLAGPIASLVGNGLLGAVVPYQAWTIETSRLMTFGAVVLMFVPVLVGLVGFALLAIDAPAANTRARNEGTARTS